MTAPDTNEAAAGRRMTPTERAHEIMLAALHRTPVRKDESVEITRNAKGDYQYTVAGVVGEGETLDAIANRVLSVARSLDDQLPLSRSQEHGRKYLPNEVKPAKQ